MEKIELRVSGDASNSTLIYLPGLHGDWTLIQRFREGLKNQVRFVETTYPRTLTWNLREYALGVIGALIEQGINAGWILGESFSSQVTWVVLELGKTKGFNIEGIILAGGFVRYPALWLIGVAQRMNRWLPLGIVRAVCRLCTSYAQWRHPSAPEHKSNMVEFMRRRSQEIDRQAICHRYTLIQNSDPRATACQSQVPIYFLCGFFDPIVPWLPVQFWLKRNCPSYQGWKLIFWASHNVLGSAPKRSAKQVLQWMQRDHGP